MTTSTSCTTNEIKNQILAPPLFASGRRDLQFDAVRFPFVEVICEILTVNGLSGGQCDLSRCHQHIADDYRLPDPVSHDSLPTTLVSRAFQENARPRELYRSFIKMLSQEILGYNVVFQAAPTFRFHFPDKILPAMRGPAGELLAYHFDMTFGDPFRQINCWLPLTPCFGTNAMLVANHSDSLSALKAFCAAFDFDLHTLWSSRRRMFERLRDDSAFRKQVVESCVPLVTNFGWLHMFDGRFLHGTAENSEPTTRVSADFRLLSVTDYEAMVKSGEISGMNAENAQGEIYLKEHFYDAKTAFEL